MARRFRLLSVSVYCSNELVGLAGKYFYAEVIKCDYVVLLAYHADAVLYQKCNELFAHSLRQLVCDPASQLLPWHPD